MIEVKNLTKRYGSHTAVSNLSFHIETGQIYGFLGPNGAGKSTTMNIMTGCLAATEGEVTVGGYDIFEDAAQAKRRIGYLPERPPLYLDRTPLEYLAFVGQAKGLTGSALEEQMRRVMAVTQIESVSNRLIKNLSKGYQQRVGIARALALSPRLVVCDEPVSALDVSVQAQMLNLLADLQAARGLTYVLVSHDLGVVRHSADRVCVMFLGRVCEVGPTEALFTAPRHPYTRFLLDSVPRPDPTRRGEGRELLPGEIPSPVTPPSGCRFRTRCPYAAPVCAQAPPPLQGTGEHRVACHAPHGEG